VINVLLSCESRYPVNRKLIRQVVERTLTSKRVNSRVEVSVTVVGDRKMRGLSKKYRGIDKTTDVLSFTFEEEKAGAGRGPDGVLRLGEIVVSFPQIRVWAKKRNRLLDEITAELVEHGCLHLLGEHHA